MTAKVLFILIASCYFFIGCAVQSRGVLDRNMSKAHNLREYCRTTDIKSPEILMADSLLKEAISAVEVEEFEDAEWQSDLAGTYYKIGILKIELSSSLKNVQQLSSELENDKEKLSGLIEVYEEIKSLRKQ